MIGITTRKRARDYAKEAAEVFLLKKLHDENFNAELEIENFIYRAYRAGALRTAGAVEKSLSRIKKDTD